MRSVIELLRHERRARVFFAALAQSALGTGAAYVALLLVALDRFDSPWAIGLVLLADVVPAMVLGPLFGALADRWSRRACVVLADVVRAVAFLGLVLVDGFVGTFLLALLAGVGTGLFNPAALAALPSLVEERRLPAATSFFGAIADFGFIAGPAIAAAVLLAGGPETILAANAVTFGLSAVALALLRFGEAPAASEVDGPRPSLLRETRDGLVATAGMAGLRVILVASGAALLFGAIFNVGQPLLAQDELGSSDAGFAVLVTAYGFGFIAGTLSGSKGGEVSLLRRRYLTGAFLMAAGFCRQRARAISCGGSRHVPGGRLRKRHAADLRAAADPGACARLAERPDLRHPRRHHGVGVRRRVPGRPVAAQHGRASGRWSQPPGSAA